MTSNPVVEVGQVRCYEGAAYRVTRADGNRITTYWWTGNDYVEFSYMSVAEDPVMSEVEVNDFLLSLNRFN
jgi:hypothetical protein